MAISETYLRYGVSNEEADYFKSLGLPASTFKTTSKKNLIDKYELKSEQIDRIKSLITRQPIDDDILENLLARSNYTCNVCHGIKGKSFIVHHIEPYCSCQSNEYHNLVVLCPTCHDLAHRPGGLTSGLNKKDLFKTKEKWEKQVEKINVEAASRNGETSDVDYINIPRIEELALNILGNVPNTKFSPYLQSNGLVDNFVNFNIQLVENVPPTRSYPFRFGNSFYIIYHYMEVFTTLLNRIHFQNLDDLLNIKQIKSNQLIGTYCFYVGGIYGKSPKMPITIESPAISMWFKRRCFYVEWIIDPKFVASTSSIVRLSEHTIYLVYGKIRNVSERNINGKDYIHFDIRPYVLAIPEKKINRLPDIHWIKKYEEYENKEAYNYEQFE